MLGVISAVGGCVQVVKVRCRSPAAKAPADKHAQTLYEYYDLHKQNKVIERRHDVVDKLIWCTQAVLDVLEGFSANLETVRRLVITMSCASHQLTAKLNRLSNVSKCANGCCSGR